jgi:hypothetical protein
MTLRPNLRFRERGFEVRIWRANACRRATLPVPVFLKRLDAPLCVFSLGIEYTVLEIPDGRKPAWAELLQKL